MVLPPAAIISQDAGVWRPNLEFGTDARKLPYNTLTGTRAGAASDG
jgi:hypothetical protein